jgi:hypothetical protein
LDAASESEYDEKKTHWVPNKWTLTSGFTYKGRVRLPLSAPAETSAMRLCA